MTHSIKSILFDLDGTLRHHIPNGSDDFNHYLMSLSISLHPEDIARAARWEHFYFASSPEIRVDSEKYPEREEFWVNFARRRLVALGCSSLQSVELAPQVQAYMRDSHRPAVHVPPETRPLIDSLKAAGYILGVVSNRSHRFEEQIAEMGFANDFHFTLAAGEVNSFKPDPGIFEEALRRSGTSARETMYVGDNYFADIVGSLRAGLHPVLYDPIGLFPEAECPIIRSFDQLPGLL
jgi:putative hydrolase of the HAD superfamily